MKKVVVIGGGVVGLCTAYYAVRRGFQVTVVEKGPAGHDSCAVGSAGMVTPSHFIPLAAPGMVSKGLRMMWNRSSPFYIRPSLDLELLTWGYHFWRASNQKHVTRSAPLLRDLNVASRSEFEWFAENTEDAFDLVRKGLLMLCKSEEGFHEESATAMQAQHLGIPVRVLSPSEVAQLEPAVKMNVVGAVLFPLDCHLSPDKFLSSLLKKVTSFGIEFHYNTEITGWTRRGTRLLAARTPLGEIPGDEFVLAAGSWSGALVRDLGLRMPMQPGKGYSLTLDNPKCLPQHCAILTEARIAVTPMGSRLRFGGTMELAGMDHSINPHRVQGIVNSVGSYLPDFPPSAFEGAPAWYGFRPCSPDGLPYIGRSHQCSNLVVATGHAMMGLSLGPITGRIVADLIANEAPPIDISLLHPNRYAKAK